MRKDGGFADEKRRLISTAVSNIRSTPPADFTKEETKIWQDILAAKGPEYFLAENQVQIAEACRLTSRLNQARLMRDAAQANYMAAQNSVDDEEGMKRLKEARVDFRLTHDMYQGLLKSQAQLFRALRLTVTSTVQPDTAGAQNERGIAGTLPKPWETPTRQRQLT